MFGAKKVPNGVSSAGPPESAAPPAFASVWQLAHPPASNTYLPAIYGRLIAKGATAGHAGQDRHGDENAGAGA